MQTAPQEIFGQGARLPGGRGRTRGLLGNFVPEARQLAGRSERDAVLLFLLRPEPSVLPAPQPHARAHDAVGPLQAGFALQERLGLVVETETRGLPVAFDAVALTAQETPGQNLRLVAAHAEIDGGFRESPGEVAYRIPGCSGEQYQTDGHETVVGSAQPFFHDGGLFVAQCRPIPPRMNRRVSTPEYPARRSREENSSMDTKVRIESGI